MYNMCIVFFFVVVVRSPNPSKVGPKRLSGPRINWLLIKAGIGSVSSRVQFVNWLDF
jgi:hypothetical protein